MCCTNLRGSGSGRGRGRDRNKIKRCRECSLESRKVVYDTAYLVYSSAVRRPRLMVVILAANMGMGSECI